MLTIETLKQSTALSGLNDDQLNAIAEMSKNDENSVIGTKIGALHGQYDADIFGITGISKNDGEKSYDYVKRVLNSYKSKSDSVKSVKDELAAANSKIAELQANLESNAGNETVSKQLKDAKAQVSQLQTQLQAKDEEIRVEKEKHEADIKSVHADYAFKSATSGLKFKDGITSAIQNTLLNSAKQEVLSKGSLDIIEVDGNTQLVLRDSNGMIINNPKNNLNPYTLQELVLETSIKDVIDTGREQLGGGTTKPSPKPNSNGTFDLSGIRNQVEADIAIENYLLSNGLTRDSSEFAEQLLKIRNDNNVAQLPIK